MLNYKKVLVTGCGSLGRELIIQLLQEGMRVTCFDNSELAFSKLEECCRKTDRLNFILADVTNYGDVEDACGSVDYVIHTIAKKYVNYVENSPQIAIDTNIGGTMNVIRSCFENRQVEKMLNVSTDKVCNAVSMYGLTKAVAERLMLWANRKGIKAFSTIRYPNFLPSDGSCFSIWQKQKEAGGPITITDPEMTRWFIPVKEAATLAIQSLELAGGGELFVPASAKKYKIMDLAKEYGSEFVFIGKRPGERLHEELMTDDEAKKAIRISNDLWRFIP